MIDCLAETLFASKTKIAFPFGFRSIGRWVETFTSNGFHINQIKAVPIIPGKFMQHPRVLFILEKMQL